MKTRDLEIKKDVRAEKFCAGYCAQEFFQENYFERKDFSKKLVLEKGLSILEKSVLRKSFEKINFEVKSFGKSCARNIFTELAKFLENVFGIKRGQTQPVILCKQGLTPFIKIRARKF